MFALGFKCLIIGYWCCEVANHHLSKSECGQEKSSPPAQSSNEQLSSIVREISQAKLMNIRKKRSELMASQETRDNGKTSAQHLNPRHSCVTPAGLYICRIRLCSLV